MQWVGKCRVPGRQNGEDMGRGEEAGGESNVKKLPKGRSVVLEAELGHQHFRQLNARNCLDPFPHFHHPLHRALPLPLLGHRHQLRHPPLQFTPHSSGPHLQSCSLSYQINIVLDFLKFIIKNSPFLQSCCCRSHTTWMCDYFCGKGC